MVPNEAALFGEVIVLYAEMGGPPDHVFAASAVTLREIKMYQKW